MFVTTNICREEARVCRDKNDTCIILSRQTRVCRDKIMFVVTNVCRDKSFVSASIRLSRKRHVLRVCRENIFARYEPV